MMRLDRVTITGADDGTSVADIVALSRDFPFVEWGILVSAGHGSEPRWPGPGWQDKFADVARAKGLRASCHVCGRWVVDIMAGNVHGFSSAENLLGACQRVQFNFHGIRHKASGSPFGESLDYMDLCGSQKKQFIFQADGVNDDTCRMVIYEDRDVVPLFDRSHGAGVAPSLWPRASFYTADDELVYHGYAGGLGPDNLADQLPLIADAAGEARFWVDMETRVRTPDDGLLDMARVRRCLEACAPHVGERA